MCKGKTGNTDVDVNIPCTLPLVKEMHLLFFIHLGFVLGVCFCLVVWVFFTNMGIIVKMFNLIYVMYVISAFWIISSLVLH